jgi:hypothetical protein
MGTVLWVVQVFSQLCLPSNVTDGRDCLVSYLRVKLWN